ncbi:MAG: hypothetical protein K0R48_296 [Gammaproteobacteria bacterium]|jgi:type II secretory pathway pseudopilin PulG|nr:hypothetical protein [Gammaproteobacteria bacterium]
MKKMLIRKPFSNMEGFTMMEVLLALVISFLVVAGIIAAFILAKTNANAHKVVNDMTTIVASVQSYIAAGNSASGATDTTLANGGFIANPFNSPWGSAYTIAGTANGTVEITVGGIGGTGDKNCTAITGLVGTAATVTAGATCKFTYPL